MFRNRINPSIRLILSAAILTVTLPCLACSQDTSASQPGSPQTAPAPTTAPAQPATQPQTSGKKKPKKVWTNDELKSVKGGVSVVGDKRNTEYQDNEAGSDSDNQDVHRQQVENYRHQIQQLRDQIDAADKRIAQLKDFKAEDTSPSGGIKMHQGYNMVPVEEQVKQLESKKKELQAKIEDVENEARKNGIEPGELR